MNLCNFSNIIEKMFKFKNYKNFNFMRRNEKNKSEILYEN